VAARGRLADCTSPPPCLRTGTVCGCGDCCCHRPRRCCRDVGVPRGLAGGDEEKEAWALSVALGLRWVVVCQHEVFRTGEKL
jgi:hypothetical protein